MLKQKARLRRYRDERLSLARIDVAAAKEEGPRSPRHAWCTWRDRARLHGHEFEALFLALARELQPSIIPRANMPP